MFLAVAIILIVVSSLGAHLSMATPVAHHNTSNTSLCATVCEAPSRRHEVSVEARQQAKKEQQTTTERDDHDSILTLSHLAETRNNRIRLIDKAGEHKRISVYLS